MRSNVLFFPVLAMRLHPLFAGMYRTDLPYIVLQLQGEYQVVNQVSEPSSCNDLYSNGLDRIVEATQGN